MGFGLSPDLIAVPKYYSGTAGTVTPGSGEIVILVVAHASVAAATWQLFGGAVIPVINGAAPFPYEFPHLLYKANGTLTLVFTNTDHYFVHTILPGNVGAGFG